MTTCILALDLASEMKVSWATRAPDGGLIHACDDFRSKQVQTSGIRFLNFRRHVAELCGSAEIEVVFVESNAAAHREWLPHLQEFCRRADVPLHSVSLGAVKRHVAGKGNVSQEAVLAAVTGLGYGPASSGEAMAIAALLYAEAGLLLAAHSNMTGGGARDRRRLEIESEIEEMRRRDFEF